MGRRGIFYAMVRLYRCSTIHVGSKVLYRVKEGDYDLSVHSRHSGLKIIAV